jgi:methionine aminopeptidase
MKIQAQSNLTSEFVKLKDQDWLKKQRIAGRVAAQTLTLLETLVKEKTTKSLIELDKIAYEFITKNECFPTFLNYKGFPQ